MTSMCLMKEKKLFFGHFLNFTNVYYNTKKVINHFKVFIDNAANLLVENLNTRIEIYNRRRGINVKFKCPEEISDEIDQVYDKDKLTIIKESDSKNEGKIVPECYFKTERFYEWVNTIVPLASETGYDKTVNTYCRDRIHKLTIPKAKHVKKREHKEFLN